MQRGTRKIKGKHKKKNFNPILSSKEVVAPPLIFQKNEADAPLLLKKRKLEISLWPHTVSSPFHQHKHIFSLTGISILFSSVVALPLSHKTATTYSLLLSQPRLLASRDLPSLSR